MGHLRAANRGKRRARDLGLAGGRLGNARGRWGEWPKRGDQGIEGGEVFLGATNEGIDVERVATFAGGVGEFDVFADIMTAWVLGLRADAGFHNRLAGGESSNGDVVPGFEQDSSRAANRLFPRAVQEAVILPLRREVLGHPDAHEDEALVIALGARTEEQDGLVGSAAQGPAGRNEKTGLHGREPCDTGRERMI